MVVIIEVNYSKRRLLRSYFEVIGKQVLMYHNQKEMLCFLSDIKENNVDVLWMGDVKCIKNNHFINEIRPQIQAKLCILCIHDVQHVDDESCVALPRNFSISDVHKLVEKFL